jgi:prepilin-type processing-associated H-X9-DG protein
MKYAVATICFGILLTALFIEPAHSEDDNNLSAPSTATIDKALEDNEALLQKLAIERRIAVFRSLYRQLKIRYSLNDSLLLPEDFSDLQNNLILHSSVDPRLIIYYGRPIKLDGTEMHQLILHDCADVGNGSERVSLFADGHVEVSSWAETVQELDDDQATSEPRLDE